MRRRRIGGLVRSSVIAGVLVWTLVPMAVAFVTSLSSEADVEAVPARWLPSDANFDAYRGLVLGRSELPGLFVPPQVSEFPQALTNSVVITSESVVAILVLSVLAGYALSRLRFRGRVFVLGALISTLLIPTVVIVVPLFRIISDLNLMDTKTGVTLAIVSANAPLAVWLFYNYCREMPIEPQEAALIDGCTPVSALTKVMLPQMWSGIAALTAIVMLSVWGSFFIPLLFASTASTKPATVFITELIGGKSIRNFPIQAAAGILTLLPPAMVAIFLNRHIRGMLSGWSG